MGVTDLIPTPHPFVDVGPQPIEPPWAASFHLGSGAGTRLSGLSGVGNPMVISRGRGLARGAASVLYQGMSAVTERAGACVVAGMRGSALLGHLGL